MGKIYLGRSLKHKVSKIKIQEIVIIFRVKYATKSKRNWMKIRNNYRKNCQIIQCQSLRKKQ